MPGQGQGGRRSRKNHVFAEKIAGLLEADKAITEWWTDRDNLTEIAAKRANEANDPCHLYVDEGGPQLVVITVQRIDRP